ncbi:TraR/DksA family transcriptional regulator [Candidatus Falkowbacteria bacterium]|nr:TraR/DksA family transcriptional regulator [Candidatus Falkowbacteria bacterium]
MNKTTLQKIKTDLAARKDKIEKELAKFTEGNEDAADARFPQFGDKEDENAAEVAAYSDSLSLEDSLQNSLKDIEKALQQIADGSYGDCKYCGQAIDEKRLLARPASSACISCKNRLNKS